MKQWQETAAVLGDLARLWQGGAHAALATVIAIRGSAYRRPGAKLLIPERGPTRGSVSGGCLEADVAEIARAALRERRPRLRRVLGPVGLDLGADGPEQVGLSVVAELLAVTSGREPRHLREREEPIHAR